MFALQDFLSQGESVSALVEQVRSRRMTHATLISGDAGTGKYTLARAIAGALLCEEPTAERIPCGHCKSCVEMEAMTHPDLIQIELGKPLEPTTTKTVIPVTDIQAMIQRISLHAFQGNRRVVIIRHAEDMNDPAQNKLLKTLEEPPEGIFFLLTSVHTERLLPTIVSRCRPLKLRPWGEQEVLGALSSAGYTGPKAADAAREAGGSFGRALQIAGDEAYWQFRDQVVSDFLELKKRGDILTVSTRWKDRREEAEALFTTLELFLSRLARRSLGLEEVSSFRCPKSWESFAERAEKEDFIRLLDAVQLARRRVQNAVPFQPVLEQLLLTLMEAISR